MTSIVYFKYYIHRNNGLSYKSLYASANNAIIKRSKQRLKKTTLKH